jgi:hypothetical protein
MIHSIVVAELDPAIGDPQHASGRLPWMPGTKARQYDRAETEASEYLSNSYS